MVLLNDPKTFCETKNDRLPGDAGKHFSPRNGIMVSRKNWAFFAGGAAVASLLTGSLIVGVKSAQTHRSVSQVTPIVVPMTVGRGQSLWSFAQKYGNGDDYILDRVNAVAKANGINTHASLVPGQRILVPVSNPQEVARLQTHLAKR